jgi:hypothetical protein
MWRDIEGFAPRAAIARWVRPLRHASKFRNIHAHKTKPIARRAMGS